MAVCPLPTQPSPTENLGRHVPVLSSSSNSVTLALESRDIDAKALHSEYRCFTVKLIKGNVAHYCY